MKHDAVFLKHILDEINFLNKKSKNLSLDKLKKDEVLKRAFARSLEIIGEAVKNINPELKRKNSEIEWKKVAGLRDKIVHYYFGVNWDILWDVIEHKLPELKKQIEQILKGIPGT